jgi:hypothetical protein
MKLIPLSKGKVAQVDDHLYDFLNQFKWHFDGRYVRRHIRLGDGKRGRVFIHRLVAKTPEGKFTDHIDGDTLNNQESNLRICNHRQNAANQKKQLSRSSIYKGVSKLRNGYRTQLWYKDEKVVDASCKEERWAAMVYDLNAAALFGEYARLNFPEAILVVQE